MCVIAWPPLMHLINFSVVEISCKRKRRISTFVLPNEEIELKKNYMVAVRIHCGMSTREVDRRINVNRLFSK